MPRTYGKRRCFHCKEQVSANGLARTSHARKHVREGLLVGIGPVPGMWDEPAPSVRYVTHKEAHRMLNGSLGHMYHVVEGDLAPLKATA